MKKNSRLQFEENYQKLTNATTDNIVELLQIIGKDPHGDFIGYDFTETDMDNLNFTEANFYASDFSNTTATNTSFNNAKFEKTMLKNTNFSSSNFRDCIFREATFDKTILNNADFSDATLDYCKIDSISCTKTKFYNTSFKNAILVNIDFSLAQLTNPDFTNATIRDSTLDIATIASAYFSKAKLHNISISQGDPQSEKAELTSILNNIQHDSFPKLPSEELNEEFFFNFRSSSHKKRIQDKYRLVTNPAPLPKFGKSQPTRHLFDKAIVLKNSSPLFGAIEPTEHTEIPRKYAKTFTKSINNILTHTIQSEYSKKEHPFKDATPWIEWENVLRQNNSNVSYSIAINAKSNTSQDLIKCATIYIDKVTANFHTAVKFDPFETPSQDIHTSTLTDTEEPNNTLVKTTPSKTGA